MQIYYFEFQEAGARVASALCPGRAMALAHIEAN